MRKVRFNAFGSHSKLICIILIVLVGFLPQYGCYDAVEVDEEVYTLAIGVDKGSSGMIRMTFQYASYKEGGGGKSAGSSESGGGGAGSSSDDTGEVDGTIVTTVESPTLLEGINLLNASANRQVSLMHAKMLVFSEEYAREGIQKYIDPLVRFREAREFMRVVVCQGKAEDFIRENKTLIGTSASKGIDLMFEQSKMTGYYPDVFFTDFYTSLLTPYGQATAVYAGVNDFNHFGEDKDHTMLPATPKTSYEPGMIPRKGGTKKELFGTAVFDGDKMVGSLDQHQTRFYLMTIGEFRTGNFTLEDPDKPGYFIVIQCRLIEKPKIKARMQNGLPVIELELKLDSNIISIQSRIHHENQQDIAAIEKLIQDYFTQGIQDTIQTTQKKWNTDIFYFGKKVAGNFMTIPDFEQYNWLAHYRDAVIKTNVSVKLFGSGSIYQASPIRSSTSIQGEKNE
ncbi:Ger(x)C family spore germination protein [Dehalobacter sp. DCM]|uniref:Ger(x)C family spore germination protein n=1 Tax=Dehalobacter sp. DCM TaxID=2907827 RepID=UPI0030817D0D|nr:Ger(x)C family spore germination protein [Dehalobacter sp. DCM]